MMTSQSTNRYTSRDLALSGLFGAAALLLPFLFHLIQLGRLFMPMYIPLVALAFFVRVPFAATTAMVTPLLSGLLLGMPPFYPPIAVVMAIELAVMATLISLVYHKWTSVNEWLVLIPVLLIGRGLSVVCFLLLARVFTLPPGFVAGLSFISGWPGLLLMVAVIPPLVRRFRSFTKIAADSVPS